MPELDRWLLKDVVDNYHDTKQLRQAIQNRILTRYVDDNGIDNSLTIYKIIDKYDKNSEKNIMIEHYIEIKKTEKIIVKNIMKIVEDYPIWNSFLKDIKGCGALIAAVLITNKNPIAEKKETNKYNFMPDLIITKPIKKPKEKCNIFLKNQLLYVLAPSFIKCGKGSSKYNDIYYSYKERIQKYSEYKNASKIFFDIKAKRYMIYIFLSDLLDAQRKLRGLSAFVKY